MALDTFTWCTQVQGGAGALSTTGSERAVQFGNGYVQMASDGFNTLRREYTIAYVGRDFMKVYEFMDKHRIKPFAWNPPDGKLGIWIVKKDTIAAKPISNGVMEITASFYEQFTSMK